MDSELTKGMRMRPPVQSVYNRQVAKCLCDISEMMEIPALVEARFKKAIEWTCKDVDKLNKHNRNGECNDEEDRFNR